MNNAYQFKSLQIIVKVSHYGYITYLNCFGYMQILAALSFVTISGWFL
jgi:hypothetical protein